MYFIGSGMNLGVEFVYKTFGDWSRGGGWSLD